MKQERRMSTELQQHPFYSKTVQIKSASAVRNGPTRRAPNHSLAVELRETVDLAVPIVLTQAGQIAMMTTDLAFIARTGAEGVAAAALAGRLYLMSVMFGVGLLTPIAPLAAQAFGADNLPMVRRSLRMGLLAALLLSIPITASALFGEQILLALSQEPAAARLAQQYLFGLAWGVAPALWFQAIRNLMSAVKRPQPVWWITLAAVPVNAVLVYILVYGKLGLPRLELFGAGVATTLVNCGTFLTALWVATMHRPFRDYHLLAHFWRFNWPLMRQLVLTGTPNSVTYLVRYALSSAAVLLAGSISTRAIVAHQIAAQVAAFLALIPLGISTAASVRVSHAVGRRDRPGIRLAGLVAIVLGFVTTVMLTMAVIAARMPIAKFLLGESTGDADATIRLAGELLLVGASYFVTDATQWIAAASLRGLKDTRVPLLFAVITQWLIGLPISYVLSLKMGLGAVGIWIGLSIGAAIYAGLLVQRFLLLANGRSCN